MIRTLIAAVLALAACQQHETQRVKLHREEKVPYVQIQGTGPLVAETGITIDAPSNPDSSLMIVTSNSPNWAIKMISVSGKRLCTVGLHGVIRLEPDATHEQVLEAILIGALVDSYYRTHSAAPDPPRRTLAEWVEGMRRDQEQADGQKQQ